MGLHTNCRAEHAVRFSILGLLGLVAVVGVGCITLTHATPLAEEIGYTTAFVLLWLGVVAALCHGYPKKAFWIGFSVCGLACFYLGNLAQSELLTERLARYVFDRFQENITTDPTSKAAPAYHYRLTFHSFASIAFAYLGGLAASYFHSRSQLPASAPATRP